LLIYGGGTSGVKQASGGWTGLEPGPGAPGSQTQAHESSLMHVIVCIKKLRDDTTPRESRCASERVRATEEPNYAVQRLTAEHED